MQARNCAPYPRSACKHCTKGARKERRQKSRHGHFERLPCLQSALKRTQALQQLPSPHFRLVACLAYGAGTLRSQATSLASVGNLEYQYGGSSAPAMPESLMRCPVVATAALRRRLAIKPCSSGKVGVCRAKHICMTWQPNCFSGRACSQHCL